MKIALFNVHYSPNLGDGLLSLCLSGEIRKQDPSATVEICDLAGRNFYGENAEKSRLATTVFDRIPAAAQRALTKLSIGRMVNTRLRPRWAQVLSQVDVAILGGGNLLIDVGLNFPLKIEGASAEIARAGKRWAVYGVGGTNNWSAEGRRLFRSAFLSSVPVHVAVRDAHSRNFWDAEFVSGGLPAAVVCPDPAILACDHLPAQPKLARPKPVLGINITAPDEIARHTGRHGSGKPLAIEWWLDLVNQSLNAGYETRLFTNGTLKDEKYLRLLATHFAEQKPQAGRLSFLPRPCDPITLAAILADCDVLAGHRMHAHVPAFSYRIPSVGFAWDVKLKNFFESVGRGEFIVDPNTQTPLAVMDCIRRAHHAGVDLTSWSSITNRARRDVADLLTALHSLSDVGARLHRANSTV